MSEKITLEKLKEITGGGDGTTLATIFCNVCGYVVGEKLTYDQAYELYYSAFMNGCPECRAKGSYIDMRISE